MKQLYLITHPEVVIAPAIPVPNWPLSPRGRERMTRLLTHPWLADIGAVYSSTEQKAIDGAEIVAHHLGLRVQQVAELGEIDRSATGYLPHAEHQATANALFSHPTVSVRGWETAVHAQLRFAESIEAIIRDERAINRATGRDIMVVTHGGVATLYLCQVKGLPISQAEAPGGANGGFYYCLDVETRALIHGWKAIDE